MQRVNIPAVTAWVLWMPALLWIDVAMLTQLNHHLIVCRIDTCDPCLVDARSDHQIMQTKLGQTASPSCSRLVSDRRVCGHSCWPRAMTCLANFVWLPPTGSTPWVYCTCNGLNFVWHYLVTAGKCGYGCVSFKPFTSVACGVLSGVWHGAMRAIMACELWCLKGGLSWCLGVVHKHCGCMSCMHSKNVWKSSGNSQHGLCHIPDVHMFDVRK